MRVVRIIILSAVVAIAVFLGCVFVGGVLLMIQVETSQYVGRFLQNYAPTVGILAGLWYGLHQGKVL